MPSPAATWLADEFAKAFSTAFAAMTGEEAQTRFSELAALEPSPEVAFRWQQLFSAGAESLLWLEVPRPAGLAIGREVLRTAGIEESDEAAGISTFAEIIQQTLAGVAGAIGRRIKKEVSCSAGAEVDALPAGELHRFQIVISSQALGEHAFALILSEGIASVLNAAVSSSKEVPAIPVSHAPAPRVEAEAPAPKTMALLMEVELPVGISFGRAQMRLKDVIKLTTGSIVELNRSITEPVEIIVNNCVIARGEVVVVEGNYGVRIQQIISREERLRTLY